MDHLQFVAQWVMSMFNVYIYMRIKQMVCQSGKKKTKETEICTYRVEMKNKMLYTYVLLHNDDNDYG